MDACPHCGGELDVFEEEVYTIGQREPEKLIKSITCVDCNRAFDESRNYEEVICEWSK